MARRVSDASLILYSSPEYKAQSQPEIWQVVKSAAGSDDFYALDAHTF